MKREDVLNRSRSSKQDEGVEYAENQGRKVGFIIFTLLFAFLAIFNLFYGETATFYAINSLYFAFSTGEAYGKYRFNKSKLYLVGTIAAGTASLFSVFTYVVTTLR